MRTLIFLVLYGGVVACVGFTVTTLFALPTWTSALLAVPAVMLADRVGAGFGVSLLARTEADRVAE